MRINGCRARTVCPTSTNRAMTFPGTRSPRSLCTRAVTTPVKDCSPAERLDTVVTRTSGGCVLGSSCSGLEQPATITIAPSSIPTDVLIVFIRSRRSPCVARYALRRTEPTVPGSSWPPAPAKRAEGANRRSRRRFLCDCEVVSCRKELTIGIEHMRQTDHARLIGFLGAVSDSLERVDFPHELANPEL